MDQWQTELTRFIPWVAFISGLGGSLHCIGMCGGLVTASCHNNKDIFRYQVGRLFSYLVLGVIGGTLGSILNFRTAHPLINFAPSIFIGALFIFWGIQSFRRKKTFKLAPRFLSLSYQHLWHRLVANNNSSMKPLLVGALSILLPCGFLYGIVLGTMATQSTAPAVLGMFFFWLGTLPSMLLAPGVMNRVLRPFQVKRPQLYALCLVLIGVGTIGIRAKTHFEMQQIKEEEVHHSCH